MKSSPSKSRVSCTLPQQDTEQVAAEYEGLVETPNTVTNRLQDPRSTFTRKERHPRSITVLLVNTGRDEKHLWPDNNTIEHCARKKNSNTSHCRMTTTSGDARSGTRTSEDAASSPSSFSSSCSPGPVATEPSPKPQTLAAGSPAASPAPPHGQWARQKLPASTGSNAEAGPTQSAKVVSHFFLTRGKVRKTP